MKEIGYIKIEKRFDADSRKSKKLRKTGFLPGNICGKELGSVPVILKKDEFKKALFKYGHNAVFKLDVDGKETYTSIVREIQYAPLNGELLHVDFKTVSLSEEIKTDVSIRIKGKEDVESKQLIILSHMDSITVKGLPQNIPDVIEIDATNLQLGDTISVGGIKLPDGIVSEMDPKQVVISVIEAKVQQEDNENENSVEEQEEA
jgi:large subunit ribosomal protein L25